jgi:hypothetical protein
MVIVASLSLQDVLVASQRISIVHVPQLFDEFVHLVVVDILEVVDLLGLLLDDGVELSADWQVEGIIDLKAGSGQAFSG